MATITVRGLDDETVRTLKVRAAREGRSMEAEVRSILTAAALRPSSGLGFGTALASVFNGVDAPDFPKRADYPEPLE